MLVFIKYHTNKFLLFAFIILINCQLQEPTQSWNFILENRSNKLVINKHNKNDVKKMIGKPHTHLSIIKIIGFISKEYLPKANSIN